MVIEKILDQAMHQSYQALKCLPADIKIQELKDMEVGLSFHLTTCRAMTNLVGAIDRAEFNDLDDPDFDEEL
jgi:hypothetical protein